MAEALQEMWKQNLGVTVNIVNEEWAVFIETRNSGNFEMARHGWVGDYVDANTMLEIFTSDNGQNDGNYNNPAFDEAIKMANETEGAERIGYLHEAEKLMLEDWSLIPLYYSVNPWQIDDKLQNVDVTADGKIWFGDAYVTE